MDMHFLLSQPQSRTIQNWVSLWRWKVELIPLKRLQKLPWDKFNLVKGMSWHFLKIITVSESLSEWVNISMCCVYLYARTCACTHAFAFKDCVFWGRPIKLGNQTPLYSKWKGINSSQGEERCALVRDQHHHVQRSALLEIIIVLLFFKCCKLLWGPLWRWEGRMQMFG